MIHIYFISISPIRNRFPHHQEDFIPLLQRRFDSLITEKIHAHKTTHFLINRQEKAPKTLLIPNNNLNFAAEKQKAGFDYGKNRKNI